MIPGRGRHEDTSNIVQFNCPEVLDFSTGSVILPLRITCYCRHHREKNGFNVHFKMLDHAGRTVGIGTTRPIMITDDHKTTGASAQKAAQAALNGDVRLSPDWVLGAACDSSEAAVSAKRKKPLVSDRSAKRTKPYDLARSTGRTVRRGSNGSLDSPPNVASAVGTRSPSPLSTFASSPVSPSMSSAQVPAPSQLGSSDIQCDGSDPLTSVFDFSSPLSSHLSTSAVDTDVAMAQQFDQGSMSLQQFADAFLPNSPSTSPSQILNMSSGTPSFMLFGQNPPPPMSSLPAPRIHRLIPASGPTFGGIEVTVLGANFHPTMQLNCTFGGTPSTSTQRWSDNTLVCMLPPCATPGAVPVWFDGLHKEEDGSLPCLFTYTDETDKALCVILGIFWCIY